MGRKQNHLQVKMRNRLRRNEEELKRRRIVMTARLGKQTEECCESKRKKIAKPNKVHLEGVEAFQKEKFLLGVRTVKISRGKNLNNPWKREKGPREKLSKREIRAKETASQMMLNRPQKQQKIKM